MAIVTFLVRCLGVLIVPFLLVHQMNNLNFLNTQCICTTATGRPAGLKMSKIRTGII